MGNEEKIRCAYCGKECTKSEMHQGTITFRNSRRDVFGNSYTFIDKKTNWYCSDKPCCAYDQMAHEG